MTGRRHPGSLGLIAVLLGACPASEQTPTEPCEDDPCGCELVADVSVTTLPTPEVELEVWRDGLIQEHAWSQSDGDTIECQRLDCQQNIVKIAFAGSAGGPRLELEVCGLADWPRFSPLDPPTFPDCEPTQRGFVARWSDGDVWQSEPGTDPCQLAVTVDGSALRGTFECTGMRSPSGSEVRISTGSFECAIEPALRALLAPSDDRGTDRSRG